ncbi:MAG: alpha/beta fold hydrolase [Streptosporangiaceae bacterium]
MSSTSSDLPAPEGPGSVSGAPNLQAGFTGTFTSPNIDAGGLRQHVVTGGDGPPLLLVHGWPQTWYAWRLVMPALARDFCRRARPARHRAVRQARGQLRPPCRRVW